jgi:hypothetical protein
MPTGPKGEKRPADSIGLAVLVGKIATGEVYDTPLPTAGDVAAQERGRDGGKARASSLDDAARSEIAKKAAKARWG